MKIKYTIFAILLALTIGSLPSFVSALSVSECQIFRGHLSDDKMESYGCTAQVSGNTVNTTAVNTTAVVSKPNISNVSGKALDSFEVSSGLSSSISGTNLMGKTAGSVSVHLGGINSQVTQIGQDLLYFTVPNGLVNGSYYDLYVSNSYGTSNVVRVRALNPTVVSSVPTCVLSTNKNSYKLGDEITYTWTSKNATYATWKQDTSGKEHLLFSGDKLTANGSLKITANVIGNPPATLLVGGLNGSGSCSATVSVVPANSANTTQSSLAHSSIKITSPIGDEVYYPGSTIKIRWTSTNIPSGVQVSIITPDSQKILTSSTLSNNTGSYDFVVKDTLTPGTYIVRVGADGASDELKKSFTIADKSYSVTPSPTYSTSPSYVPTPVTSTAKPSLTVLTPSNSYGSSYYNAGETVKFQWSSVNALGVSRISLTPVNGGSIVYPLNLSSSVTPLNASSYNWVIPKTVPTGKYKVKVSIGNSLHSESVGYITINNTATVSSSPSPTAIPSSSPASSVGNTITVLTPTNSLGLSEFKVGDQLPIMWSSTGIRGVRMIKLVSTSNTANNVTALDLSSIYKLPLTTDSFTWTVPNTVTAGKYKVLVQMGLGKEIMTETSVGEITISGSAVSNAYSGLTLAEEVKLLVASKVVLTALKNKDYSTLEGLTSTDGLSLNLYPNYLDFSKSTIKKDDISEIPNNKNVYLLGYSDGSGAPINSTISDFIDKRIYNYDYINFTQKSVNQKLDLNGAPLNTIANDVKGRNFAAFNVSSTNNVGNDWSTIYLIFDYQNGEYKLRYITKSNWTI